MTVPLALYVHIPFCAYRCRYCNFTFETGWSPALMQRTLDALAAEAGELRVYGESQGFEWEISTLYIGGGTPGLIPPELLLPFLRRLEDTLGYRTANLPEATLEANPENVTDETLAAWAESGLNRLSVGVKKFDSVRLALLGRWCDGPTNRRARSNGSRERWRGRWSADLMTGLPGRAPLTPQRWIDLRADLDELLSYGPGHISLYSLIVEPGTDSGGADRQPRRDAATRSRGRPALAEGAGHADRTRLRMVRDQQLRPAGSPVASQSGLLAHGLVGRAGPRCRGDASAARGGGVPPVEDAQPQTVPLAFGSARPREPVGARVRARTLYRGLADGGRTRSRTYGTAF